ncbi:S24 family peptidase [Allopusillimonas ginsengisoli]|uniref:S24 family peptidase n=1 Tax=Allopusillimonas ginsengisoli TaxID=453575 RepID=UPI0039C3248F
MKTTLQERAQIFIPELDAKGIDQVDIAKAAGVTKGAVNQWLSGGIKSMKMQYALGIQDAYGYNHRWLVMGEEPKFIKDKDAGSEKPAFDINVSPANIGARRIPLLNYVQAGVFTEMGSNFATEGMEYLLTDLALSNNAFALEIKGKSMTAPPGSSGESFNEGDRIIVDCDLHPRPGDFVVAKNGGEEATFKKYRLAGVDADTGNEIFELMPLNPDYPSLRSDERAIYIIGVMVEHRRYRR